ncbi:hypothetical protein GRAN_2413 [Granulicella sibirica]|uniref:Uncharacterized protein n=2 Tax=Granulicella sibirica TaxID=2479048 RepID=A0A4Q0T262_9BACT|nr:hypothetical protein GRAN_2413 [Granulicella sibirica]
MGILFAISIFSFLALLWAAFSIARHVRKSHRPEQAESSALGSPTGNATPKHL